MHNEQEGVVGQPTPDPLEFAQTLEQVRQGASPDKLGWLFERFRPYLLTIALGELPEQLHGKLGVSDVVQETMLRGIEHFDGFRGSTREEFAAWLRQILLHYLANTKQAYAANKRDVGREVPADSRLVDPLQASPSVETLSEEEWEQLQRALDNLPEVYRQAILLRHRENLTFIQIGRLMNRSEDAARKLWCRAIEQLQRELNTHAPQP